MDYFWKENKKFLLAAGGGLLVVFLYWNFFLSPVRRAADQAAGKRASQKKELESRMEQGVPSEEAVRAARHHRDRSRQALATLTHDVGFALPERYRKSSDPARAHFDDLRIRVQRELQARAVKARIAFPAAMGGMGEAVAEEQLPEFFDRLAAAERLATVAIESEVNRIDVLDIQAGDAPREGRTEQKSPFLERRGVFMKFSAKSEAVMKVLHAVQKKGNYLAVMRFEARRPDPTKDLLEASIAAAVLKVDPEATIQ